MTREEAIAYGKNYYRDLTLACCEIDEKHKGFVRMSLEALEQEPCDDCDYSEIMDWEQDAKTGKAKPIYWCERHKESCEDAVSRQAVIELLPRMAFTSENRYRQAYSAVENLPSVQPKAKTGRWLVHNKGNYEFIECDKCQTWFRHDNLIRNSFCPNCGADMRETE